MSQDPIGDGVNWYAYVGSNPVVWVDPEGESAREVWETAKAFGSRETWGEGYRVGKESGYYRAWLIGMVIPTPEEVGMQVAKPHVARGLVRAGYHFTDGRFTAWGKYSKVLVPRATRVVSGATSWLMVYHDSMVSMIDAAPLVMNYGFAPGTEGGELNPCP